MCEWNYLNIWSRSLPIGTKNVDGWLQLVEYIVCMQVPKIPLKLGQYWKHSTGKILLVQLTLSVESWWCWCRQKYYWPVDIILYYSLLFFIILYYSLLFFIILYYSLLFFIILYYSLLFFIILYYSLLFFIILYYSLLFFIILYYFLLFFIILYYYVSLSEIAVRSFSASPNQFQSHKIATHDQLEKNQRIRITVH